MTLCYIINRQGIKNILDSVLIDNCIMLTNLYQNFHPAADEMIFKWAGNTYFLEPCTVFVYNDKKNIKTTIQDVNDFSLNFQLENSLYVINKISFK